MALVPVFLDFFIGGGPSATWEVGVLVSKVDKVRLWAYFALDYI